MFRRLLCVLLGAAGCLVVMGPSSSYALRDIYDISSHSSGEQQIIIGMARHGSASYRAFACYDPIGSNNEIWISLGTTSGLNDDYNIHASAVSGDFLVDDIFVARGNVPLTGDCASDGGTSWQALNYNGHWLDIHASGGDDEVFGGAGDTMAMGDSGNDDVNVFSCIGLAQANGASGNDRLRGFAGNCDDLFGGKGSDCLDDTNNVSGTYDCGPGTDSYHSGDSPDTGCENSVSFCPAP